MGGRYKPYSEYEDSEIKGLRQVPKHWRKTRIKFFSQINPSKSELAQLDKELEVSFLPMEAIGENGELDVSQTKTLGSVLNGYTYVTDGDVMLAKITPCFENGKGAIAYNLTNGIGFATTEIIPLRCSEAKDREYLYYLLHSEPFRKIAEGSMYGAGGQKRVSDNFVANYHFALPPKRERQTIAAFLEHKTNKIDTLIAKQQKLIELLKEKRQAVISHAVTKGLNSDAPMKDSGIEWFGKVPKHWKISSLKHFVDTINGFGFKSSDTCDEGVPFIRAGNIKSNTVTPTNLYLPPDVVKLQKRVILSAGDIIISMVGSHPKIINSAVGQIGIVPLELDGAVPNQNIVILKEKSGMGKQFLFYTLLSTPYRNHLNIFSHQLANQSIISSTLIIRGNCLIPPIQEQEQITTFLDDKLKKIEQIIQKAGRSLYFLQERRTALISAAVTGKIDVRDWQPNKELEPNPMVRASE